MTYLNLPNRLEVTILHALILEGHWPVLLPYTASSYHIPRVQKEGGALAWDHTLNIESFIHWLGDLEKTHLPEVR